MKIFLSFALLFVSLMPSCRNKDAGTSSLCNDKCSLQPDPGPCEAHMPRYYYDQTEKKCKEFIWGGCHGVVPFESLEACESCGCE